MPALPETRLMLLARFADATIAHGLNGAGLDLLLSRRGGDGCGRSDGATIIRGIVDARLVHGSEVVGGLEATLPCFAVHEARLAGVGIGHPQIGALRLVQPLLAHGSALQDP